MSSSLSTVSKAYWITPNVQVKKVLPTIVSKDHWITPDEQLKRVFRTAEKVSSLYLLPPVIAGIVAEYVNEPILKNWHTFLKLLKIRVTEIPPLPEDIEQMVESDCPIYNDVLKEDGSTYKIKDTHILALVLKEYIDLDHLERNVLIPYGDETYGEAQHPLRFSYFSTKDRQQYGKSPFSQSYWVLMTKNILPRSRNRVRSVQFALVDTLSKETRKQYEVPTLHQAFVAIMTHKVATGECLYDSGNDKNGHLFTHTWVNNRAYFNYLVIGGFSQYGIHLNNMSDQVKEEIGIAAVLRL
jgi:hypothetical protein